MLLFIGMSVTVETCPDSKQKETLCHEGDKRMVYSTVGPTVSLSTITNSEHGAWGPPAPRSFCSAPLGRPTLRCNSAIPSAAPFSLVVSLSRVVAPRNQGSVDRWQPACEVTSGRWRTSALRSDSSRGCARHPCAPVFFLFF
jgi:hypothetical protein